MRPATKTGTKLFVNYMRRSDSGSVELKRRIESGEISSPIKGVAWYSKGFLHNGSHLFNLMEFWLGEFEQAKVLNPGHFLNNQDSEPDVLVEFERGEVVFLAGWEEAFSHCTIELLSPSGRLRYDQGGGLIAWQPAETDPFISGYKMLKAGPEIIHNDMDGVNITLLTTRNALGDRPFCSLYRQASACNSRSMHKIIHPKK